MGAGGRREGDARATAEGRWGMEQQDARTGKRARAGRVSRPDAQAASDTQSRHATSAGPSSLPAPTARPAAAPDLELPTLRLPSLAKPPTAPGPPGMTLSPARSAPRSRALSTRMQPPEGAAPLVVPPSPTRRLRTTPVPRGPALRSSRPATL